MSSITASWKQIDQSLKQHAPATFKALGRPATEQQLALLQRKIGGRLPADLVSSLRRHNGTRDPYRLATLFDNEFLLSTVAIAQSWGVMKQLLKDGHFEPGGCPLTKTRKIKNDQWWNPAWVPITDDNSDGFMIDLDPARRGRVGQVFYFYHDGARAREVVAPSYAAWLADLAKALARGRFQAKEGTLWLDLDR
jgi:cell wall assembly regulator SMI1